MSVTNSLYCALFEG